MTLWLPDISVHEIISYTAYDFVYTLCSPLEVAYDEQSKIHLQDII